MLNEAALISLANDVLLPGFDKDALNLTRLDRWSRWSHDQPHAPRQATVEYRQLADRAHAPWLMIPINSISQQMYVDGFRAPSDPDDAEVWGLSLIHISEPTRRTPISYAVFCLK